MNSWKCLCQVWNSFRWIYSFHWIKFVKYVKSFKIQGTGCYDINVTFMSSPKVGLLEFIKSKFRHVSSFSPHWKEECTILDKRLETNSRNILQNIHRMFYSWYFAIFYQKTSKFGLRVYSWVIAIKPKHFRDFLEIS